MGDFLGTTAGLIKGDTGSLDSGSYIYILHSVGEKFSGLRVWRGLYADLSSDPGPNHGEPLRKEDGT